MNKRIVVLVGSLRKESYNRIIAENLQSLSPEGVEIEILNGLDEYPLYDMDIQNEKGFPEIAIKMGQKIKKSDGVIIVSPEYNYSIPGVLKNAIDWLSRLEENPFDGKKVALQSGSMGAGGGARMQYHLRQVFVYLNSWVINRPEIIIGSIQDKVDTDNRLITDDMTKDFIRAQIKALVS